MTPEQWQQVNHLFAECLDTPPRKLDEEDHWGFWIRATYQQKPVSVRVKAKPTPAPA